MTHGMLPRGARTEPERPQRELVRRSQVAQPVLVMNRKCLGRFPRNVWRAAAQLHDALPRVGRFGVSPLTAAHDGIAAQRFGARKNVAGRKHARVRGRNTIGFAREIGQPAALVETAETQRLTRGSRRRRALLEQP
jgi:hypothetical protein